MSQSAPAPPPPTALHLRPQLRGLVVALVAAVVLATTLVALFVGLITEKFDVTDSFRTVSIGPATITVSDAAPGNDLLGAAITAIVLVVVIALTFEGIAALLSARP